MIEDRDTAGDLSAQESLDLIQTQQRGAARRLYPDPVPLFGVWGVTWLIGFGACYLASSGGQWHVVPGWVAGVLLGVGSVLSAAYVAWHVASRGRGVRGPSRTVGASYGWCWVLAFAGVFALDIGLTRPACQARLAPLLWPGTSAVVAGVMYLAGGLLFSDRVQFGLGGWMLAVGAGSVFAGWPANFAVLALAGGGGFLAAAALSWFRRSRGPGDMPT